MANKPIIELDATAQKIYNKIKKSYTPERLYAQLESQPLQHIALSMYLSKDLDNIEECAVFDLDEIQYAEYVPYYRAFVALKGSYENTDA